MAKTKEGYCKRCQKYVADKDGLCEFCIRDTGLNSALDNATKRSN